MNKLKKLAATVVASSIGIVALAACAPDIREVPDTAQSAQSGEAQSGEAQSGEESAPVLDEARIQRIVDEVQEVLDRAAEENDPEILKERLIDGALKMRQGQFSRAAATGTDLPPLQIEVNVASATASDAWPRVLLVGSAASPDDPAEIFIFQQDDAKSDYMLENWVRALGGNSVRGVAVEAGSKILPADASGFIMSPEAALKTYVDFLNDPDNEEYQRFDDNTIAPQYREERDKLVDAVEEVGEITYAAKVADYPVTTVQLATDEALVASSFTYTVLYDRTVAGSTMTLGGTPAAYLEDPDVIGTATVTYLVNLFFTIPPEGSEQNVRIVGAERAILSVTKDDEALPEGE